MYSFKQHLFFALENKHKSRWGKYFGYFLFTLILLNVSFVMLETVEGLAQYHTFFWTFEIISVTLFSIEYLLRIWTAPLKDGFEKHSWRYLFTPLMLFDLFVLLPFYLTLLGTPFIDLRELRVLRLVRIFRIFRLSKYSVAMDRVLSVLHKEKEELFAVFGLIAMLLLISSSLVYFVEHGVDASEYPGGKNQFTSIPATLWWGMATITTIGYGDMVPITDLGKFFGFITGILGIAIVALPTGLLGASFYQEITDNRERKMELMKKQLEEIMLITQEHGDELDKFMKKHYEREKKLKDELENFHSKEHPGESESKNVEASREKLSNKIQETWKHLWS